MNLQPLQNGDGPPNPRSRVVVMDDQLLIRAGLVRLLNDGPFHVCGEAGSIAELLSTVESTRPHVVVGEITLQEASTIEAIPKLRNGSAAPGVLFYSASNNPLDEARAFDAGANGYLYRTVTGPEFFSALERVAQGDSLWTGADQRRLSSYRRDGRIVVGNFAPLTPREQEILQLLTLGLTNRDISQSLSISHETVKEHVQHILQKIGVSDRTQAAVWAVRNGFA